MKRFALAAVLLLVAASAAAEPPAPNPKVDAKALFEKWKALAGTWESGDKDGDGQPDWTVVYRVTAGGSAVMETLFPGTPKEMVTMYTVDGDDFVLTHYCAMGNQPRMKAVPSDVASRVTFEFVSGGNMKSRDEQHMDSLTAVFKDATHVRHDWTMWADGKAAHVLSFDWTRKAE